MARVAMRKRWELSLHGYLASNHMYLKQCWSLVKQHHRGEDPTPKTAFGNLVIANQDKVELGTAHFGGKM